MAKYVIETVTGRYTIDGETGFFVEGVVHGEYRKYSNRATWQCIGFTVAASFGRRRYEYGVASLPKLANQPRSTYRFKNGKPKLFIRDFDYGSIRDWGEGVRYISKVIE